MNTRKQISLKEELNLHNTMIFDLDQIFIGKSKSQIEKEMQEQIEMLELLEFYETN